MQFVSIEQLALFIGRCFIAVEVPEDDAKIVAELMSEADVNGSDGHGVFRLPQYIERIKNKGINLQPNISIADDLSLIHISAPTRQGKISYAVCS